MLLLCCRLQCSPIVQVRPVWGVLSCLAHMCVPTTVSIDTIQLILNYSYSSRCAPAVPTPAPGHTYQHKMSEGRVATIKAATRPHVLRRQAMGLLALQTQPGATRAPGL